MNTPGEYRSPAFALAGAVPAPEGDIDAGVPWHFGDPHAEQRRLLSGTAHVDLSHRGVIRVSGPDRLTWLHSLTTQALENLAPNSSTVALVLSPHGHVEHEIHLVDDGDSTWLIVDAASTTPLVEYLDSMRFMLRVEVFDVSDEWAVVWQPGLGRHETFLSWEIPAEYSGRTAADTGSDRGGDATKYIDHRPDILVGREVLVPRQALLDELGVAPAGTWALEALRVASAIPRAGLETDHRTLPHEVGWIGPGVHLAKGCYRGQEAVARVHNLGRPPRRLALLHLDGGAETLPQHGDAVILDGRTIGWIGTAARHFELGPIATAIIKRSVPVDADLIVQCGDGTPIAASQEVVVSA